MPDDNLKNIEQAIRAMAQAYLQQNIPVPMHKYKARAYVAANQSMTDAVATLISLDTKDYDPNNNYDTTNKRYVAPVTGYYQVSFSGALTSPTGKGVSGTLTVRKNGATFKSIASTPYPAVTTATDFPAIFSESIYLIQNDYIDFLATVDSSDGSAVRVTATASASFHLLSTDVASSVPLTSTLGSTNPYVFHVYRNAAQNTGAGAFAVLACDTEVFDPSNLVSSGVFTAPVAGYYQFNWLAGVITSGTQQFVTSLFVNGTRYSDGGSITITTSDAPSSGADTVRLFAGDTVDVRVYCTGARPVNVGNIAYNRFSGFLISQL